MLNTLLGSLALIWKGSDLCHWDGLLKVRSPGPGIKTGVE